jgi:hypothetical protein
MWARWKLDQLLSATSRAAGPGRGKKIQQAADSFMGLLSRLKLDWDTANRAQSTSEAPEAELNALAGAIAAPALSRLNAA